MVPDSDVPILPAPDLSLHSDPRAGPTVRWEPKPRGFVNTEGLLQAFVYTIASCFLISSIPMGNQHSACSANYS